MDIKAEPSKTSVNIDSENLESSEVDIENKSANIDVSDLWLSKLYELYNSHKAHKLSSNDFNNMLVLLE